MIGTIHDVLLATVRGQDTVNAWRNKTNAIIDFINRTPVESLPAVVYSDVPPDPDFRLWFNTTTNTLMVWDNSEWVPFHQFYALEMKFYQKVISHDKIVPVGYNAVAVSPVIADGVTVVVEEGSTLRII